MGEYEPHDSRNVTLKRERAPGEPPRTGPRESETRRQPTELEQDQRDDATKRERAVEIGEDGFEAERGHPES